MTNKYHKTAAWVNAGDKWDVQMLVVTGGVVLGHVNMGGKPNAHGGYSYYWEACVHEAYRIHGEPWSGYAPSQQNARKIVEHCLRLTETGPAWKEPFQQPDYHYDPIYNDKGEEIIPIG